MVANSCDIFLLKCFPILLVICFGLRCVSVGVLWCVALLALLDRSVVVFTLWCVGFIRSWFCCLDFVVFVFGFGLNWWVCCFYLLFAFGFRVVLISCDLLW